MTPKQMRDKLPHLGGVPDLARRDLISTMYKEGYTIRRIAEDLGISYQAVHAMLKRIGVELRPRGGNFGSHSRHRR